MIGPKEKKERSLGERLYVKGDRCNSPKCAVVRKPNRPGVHGHKRQRKNLSDFGRQIREKQKFKISYGLDERGLRRIFIQARKKSGETPMQFMELLERRLDNVVFRLGFAPSRSAARQLIIHGHIFVNKDRVRSPGFSVKVNDLIYIRAESKTDRSFSKLSETLKKYQSPSWLSLDSEKLEGKVTSLPKVDAPFDTDLLVESFSKVI